MLCWRLISRNQSISDSENTSSPNEALSDVSEAKNSQGKPQATDPPEESFKELWKTKDFVANTADSRGTSISGSAPPDSLTGFWCAKPAGRTFENKLVIATEEPARPTAATENGANRIQAQVGTH